MNRLLAQIKSIIHFIGKDRCRYLLMTDEKGVIQSANKEMRDLLCLSKGGMNKKSLFDFLPEPYRTETEVFLESSHRTVATCSGWMYHENKFPLKLNCNLHRLITELGDKDLFLFTAYEITGEEEGKAINKSLSSGDLRIECMQDERFVYSNANDLMSLDIQKKSKEALNGIKHVVDLPGVCAGMIIKEGQKIRHEFPLSLAAIGSGKQMGKLPGAGVNHAPPKQMTENLSNAVHSCSTDELTIILNNTNMNKKGATRANELEAIFQSFMNETPNMAWVIDEDENLVLANKMFTDFFRIDKDAFNSPIADSLPERVVTFLYKKHKEVFTTGKPVHTIQKAPMADGSTLIFLVNIFPIESVSSKKIIGGLAINVTENYTIEKKLKLAQERLFLLSHTTTDAIWEWDMQTGQMFRNAALMDMIGYPELSNSNGLAWWLRRIHPEDRRRLEEKLKEATDNGLKSWEDEYRFKCANGIYKNIHDRGFIVYENGLPVRMIGSLNDVTQVKQLQRQLQEEKLERQKQISEIILKVQEQERAKIGRELHDNVNQILSTCMLFVDMLKPGSREQKKYKEKSLEYLQSAIEEIRTLSKELVISDLNEMGLVEGVQKLVGDIQMSDKVRIEFVQHITNVQLSTGKKITLFRIIQEQLKNILSYSRAKHVEISLGETEGMVHLTVNDDGIGFDPKQTRRGIGLSNIYERTRFYNGTTNIVTAPGKGCILTVKIPVAN